MAEGYFNPAQTLEDEETDEDDGEEWVDINEVDPERESGSTSINCPKCRTSAAVYIDEDCFLGDCRNCEFLFCSQCRESYHGFKCKENASGTPFPLLALHDGDAVEQPYELHAGDAVEQPYAQHDGDDAVEQPYALHDGDAVDQPYIDADEDELLAIQFQEILLAQAQALKASKKVRRVGGSGSSSKPRKGAGQANVLPTRRIDDSVVSQPPPVNVAEEKREITCSICLTDVRPEDIIELDCSHNNSCRTCTKTYFETQIENGDIHGLRCPEPKCGVSASHHLIQSLISPEIFVKFDKLLLSEALGDFPEVVNCPKPDCQQRLYADPEYGYCDLCEYRFCTGCNQAFHGAAPCWLTEDEMKMYMRRYAAADDAERVRLDNEIKSKRKVENDASERLIALQCKKCPQCKADIEKIAGCNTIHCTQCRCNFCWLCGIKIMSRDPHDHFQNNSRCALFEVPPE